MVENIIFAIGLFLVIAICEAFVVGLFFYILWHQGRLENFARWLYSFYEKNTKPSKENEK